MNIKFFNKKILMQFCGWFDKKLKIKNYKPWDELIKLILWQFWLFWRSRIILANSSSLVSPNFLVLFFVIAMSGTIQKSHSILQFENYILPI